MDTMEPNKVNMTKWRAYNLGRIQGTLEAKFKTPEQKINQIEDIMEEHNEGKEEIRQ